MMNYTINKIKICNNYNNSNKVIVLSTNITEYMVRFKIDSTEFRISGASFIHLPSSQPIFLKRMLLLSRNLPLSQVDQFREVP
jgi:hypothetical protein